MMKQCYEIENKEYKVAFLKSEKIKVAQQQLYIFLDKIELFLKVNNKKSPNKILFFNKQLRKFFVKKKNKINRNKKESK